MLSSQALPGDHLPSDHLPSDVGRSIRVSLRSAATRGRGAVSSCVLTSGSLFHIHCGLDGVT